MAENINSSNIGSQPSGGVNAFEDLASQSNERIEDTVVAGSGGNNKQVVQLLSLLQVMNLNIKVMMMRQQYMEGSLKHVVNKVDENRSTELKVAARKSEQVLGGPQVTPNGATKMDWDSIHLEPFENKKDDLYFVVGSDEDDGYFHDMAIKKSKQKLPTHSSKTPRKYITGNSFVKTENDVFYNMEKGVDLKQLASNFMGGNKECHVGDTSFVVMPKKLSFSPSGSYKKQKMSSVEAAKKCTPRNKQPTKGTNCSGETPKNVISVLSPGAILPKAYVKTKFKPSLEMDLTPTEVHLSLYIFRVDGDSSECLIKIGNVVYTRGSLDCLCPDKRVDRELVRLLARKITYIQQQQESQTVWCLPPIFVWDVLRGNHVPKLLDDYTEVWMSPSQTVKYIYVPFEAYDGHWSLFVVGLHEAMLYYFDSFEDPETLPERQRIIHTVGNSIGQMVHCKPYPAEIYSAYHEVGEWEITNVNSVTNTTDLLNSGAAILDWMSMAEAFTANVSPMKNANLVRMKTALNLVQGVHNSIAEQVKEKAEAFWKVIRNNQQK
ncbi:Ulp1 protease family, C-terminal catalytic domain [Sesbania bispinosa]|nr:Ulp1 protease family, C-terminal catalytic domain [Sesbania bispinosa]